MIDKYDNKEVLNNSKMIFYFVNKISFSLLFSKIAVVRNILLNVSGVMGSDYRYDNERG